MRTAAAPVELYLDTSILNWITDFVFGSKPVREKDDPAAVSALREIVNLAKESALSFCISKHALAEIRTTRDRQRTAHLLRGVRKLKQCTRVSESLSSLMLLGDETKKCKSRFDHYGLADEDGWQCHLAQELINNCGISGDDATHIVDCKDFGGEFLLTADDRLCEKKALIWEVAGVRVVSPVECLSLLPGNLAAGQRDANHKDSDRQP